MEDSRTHATDFEEEAENQEESNSNLNFPPKVQLAMHANVDNLPHTRDSKKDKPLSLGPGPQQIILRPDSSKNEWITTMSSNQGLVEKKGSLAILKLSTQQRLMRRHL
ncbi:hypothetical protein ACFE04_013718 [Oxalis oulophora]